MALGIYRAVGNFYPPPLWGFIHDQRAKVEQGPLCGWWWWWGGCYISIHVSVLCDSVYQKTLLKDVSEMQFEGDIKSAPSEGQLLQVNVNDQ